MSDDELPRPSMAPCGTCPYRRDVPSGIWDAREYAKLPQYDGDTMDQVEKGATALFYCHQNDGHLCAGWAGCHDTDHLLALRINPVHPDTFGYVSPIPLFSSGAEAAAHGMEEIDCPSHSARQAITKLEAKQDANQRYRLKQCGLVVASAEGQRAATEIAHYAAVYSQDGPVVIEQRVGSRWRKVNQDQVEDDA